MQDIVGTWRLVRGTAVDGDGRSLAPPYGGDTLWTNLGAAYDGNLTRSHLRDDANVYNTYRHSGLPPTPIALPGRAAVRAAMHPAPGNAFYFVARGDGGHVFSATLAEHQKAVRKYQLQRRKDYRSSPGSK